MIVLSHCDTYCVAFKHWSVFSWPYVLVIQQVILIPDGNDDFSVLIWLKHYFTLMFMTYCLICSIDLRLHLIDHGPLVIYIHHLKDLSKFEGMIELNYWIKSCLEDRQRFQMSLYIDPLWLDPISSCMLHCIWDIVQCLSPMHQSFNTLTFVTTDFQPKVFLVIWSLGCPNILPLTLKSCNKSIINLWFGTFLNKIMDSIHFIFV